ncbi:glycosyltransferase family 4 protein [Candidatus Roizmanbacteria bacterium]|nr:glycosyltransferase family 4 protein [Candidatus Roizmanbacteria bacterium]
MSNTITVCYFGVGEKSGKNLVNLARLKAGNVGILEVFVEDTLTTMTEEGDFGLVSSLKRILTKLKLIPKVLTNINTIRNSDVIFVGFPGHLDVPLAYIVSRMFRKPLIFDPVVPLATAFVEDVGALPKQSMKIKIIKYIEQFVLSLSDSILVDTKVLKQFFSDEYHIPLKKLHVVPLGADEHIYHYKPHETIDDTVRVVYYGLYNPIHGVEYILDAANYCRTDPRIRFLMVGNGKLYPVMKEKATKEHLTNVEFYPNVTEKNALPLLQSADIFLGFIRSMPAVERFIPNKVFQGIALGKAVITADSASIRGEFTDKNNIYLIPQGNAKELAVAIKTLKQNEKLREQIAANGYKLFRERFSSHAIGKQLAQVLQEAQHDAAKQH